MTMENNRVSRLRLYSNFSNLTLIVSFIVCIRSSTGHGRLLAHSEIKDFISKGESFLWQIDVPLPSDFIIQIEFLDFKTASPNGGEPYSIWPNRFLEKRPNQMAILGRMLTQSIHTDITINVDGSNGSIGAHRAVLVAQSPVFRSMFSHNLKENNLSVINISDMSMEAFQSFLNYLYGTIEYQEFLTHRFSLLHAADKYDVCNLREACEESLLQDMDANNVLERLQTASLYQLPKLKADCMLFLVKFGKIFDIRDDFTSFLQTADRDLISQLFHEILDASKGL